ncbi:MAG: helix-turn-helix domain-containing protein [Rikenellaceae bacterium]
MTQIETKMQYKAVMERIEELLPIVGEDTSSDDKNFVELDLLSGLVSDYEEIHFPINKPTLGSIIKLRMYEMKLTQKGVAQMLGISPSRVSEFINGRSEPTLQVARDISIKLNIDASIVLGV